MRLIFPWHCQKCDGFFWTNMQMARTDGTAFKPPRPVPPVACPYCADIDEARADELMRVKAHMQSDIYKWAQRKVGRANG